VTALLDVAVHLPGQSVAIEEVGERYGLTPMQVKVFRRYHKLGEVRRDPDGGLIDLLRAAVAGLDGLRGREQQVRYVLHARTYPVVVPYPLNPVRDLCREFGLDYANALSVGQHACSSGLLALDVAGRLLAADPEPGALALVLAGEKTFTAETELLPDTSFLSEGASACLVGKQGPRDRVVAYAVDLRGEYDEDGDQAAMAFQRDYAPLMAGAITAALDRAGLALGAISAILPHNVNAAAWRQVCRILGLPLDRVVLDNVTALGHMFCADAFVNYRTAVQRGLLRPGQHYVMAAGAGRGAAFSAMILEH
jgi:3-oxoacyl-[acyl-carrier-protein] synthase III